MSRLRAKVSEIAACEGVHIVKFICHDSAISMMSLALGEAIMIGKVVSLLINPTHVAISREGYHDISYANQLPATIESITHGTLLSTITLAIFDETLESIITQESAKRMGLKVGDKVVALIKASEVSIEKVYDV